MRSEPLCSWCWAWRASWLGVLLAGSAALLAALLSLWSQTAALAFAGIYGLLVCAPLAVVRLGGGAGITLALICCVMAIGSAHVAHRAWVVTRVSVVETSGTGPWPVDALALRLPEEMLHQHALRGAASWTTNSGINHKSTQHYQVVVPLALSDDGPIVAFDCHDGYGEPSPDGRILLLSAAFAGGPGHLACARPVAAAMEKIAVAGRTVAAGAQLRVGSVHADEAKLRQAHGLGTWVKVSVVLLGLYALGVWLFRHAGARSVG